MSWPSPRKTKIRPESYAVDSKDFSKLLLIASQMIDPTNDTSSDAYRGVKIDRGGLLSCFGSSTRVGSHIFSRKNWSAWLWSTGWVESRLEIPLLQANLIINKCCVLVRDSDNRDQQKFVVSKRIQKAVQSEHGILGFGEAQPLYRLDDGNDGTLYSFGRNRRKGDSNNQVRLSSKALKGLNLNRGYYVSKTNKTVPPPPTDLNNNNDKNKKKKKKKKKNATNDSMGCEEEAKILYIMHRQTIAAQQYNF